MKKDFKKPACAGREIEWLIRDKYNGSFSHCRLGFERDLERLKKGEPIDYVIGWKEFWGCKIDLSEKPLIPREETEFWVGGALKEIANEVVRSRISGSIEKRLLTTSKNDFSLLPRARAKEVGSRVTRSNFASPLKVLDLFAGSGCIGLAVLKHCPDVQMTFADKEENCVMQIKKNLKLNDLKGKVIQADIFKGLRKFDIIFANPPYIPSQKSKVQKSVKNWEPKEALWAGTDGLLIIKKFLKEAKTHLNPNGKIYLEFGYGQKKAIENFLKLNKYKSWEFKKDQFGRFRLVKVIGG